MFLTALTQPACVLVQTSSLSQQQSPAWVHLVSHQQKESDPPPHLVTQLPEDIHSGGRVVVGIIVSSRSSCPAVSLLSIDGSVEDVDTAVAADTDVVELVDPLSWFEDTVDVGRV